MRIRTGFHVVLIIAGVFVVASAVALGFSQLRMTSTVAHGQALDNVVTEGLQLVQLTNETLLYGGQRAMQQWQVQFDETGRLVRDGRLGMDAAAAPLLARVGADIDDMRPLFEAFVQARRSEAVPTDPQRLRLLSSQLFQKATLLQASLRDLKALSERQTSDAYADAKSRQQWIFGVVGAVFFAFAVVVMQAFRRVVLAPVQRLEQTIRDVNAGERDERARLASADEIGLVGRAFDDLLDQQEVIRQELQETADRFRATFEQAAVGIGHVGLDGAWLRVNRRLCDILGYQPADLCARPLASITHPGDLGVDDSYRRDLISGRIDTFAVETRLRRAGGDDVWVNQTVSLVRDAAGVAQYFIIVFEDISPRKAAEQEIAFLAYHDVLTKLPNRILVRDRFEQAVAFAARTGSRVAALFLDLDNFKSINDTLGHPVGDQLLKAVALRLESCVREMDSISRQGGDEFLVTLAGVEDVDAVTRIADKLLKQLAEPFQLDGYELSTSVSIGIAMYPDDSSDFDSLLKKADVAMYQAKESGRNTYRFFTAQMNVDASEHLMLRNGLARAIERSEFVLHYQPQLDLQSGRVLGAEALIRWNHPEMGLIPPSRFIPVAEDSGLIVQVGDWVLQTACREAAAWAANGLPGLTVAVNLSAVQFKRGDLVSSVQRAVEAAGLPPQQLELELTESILIADTDNVLAMVRELKAFGVTLSIDDFGTGYSSLSYLRRFNLDRLKIDQSFIRELESNPDDATIVNAIIQLARNLGLVTIAEGVENELLVGILRRYGCDMIQGYWCARPMASDAFQAFLRSGVPSCRAAA
jgi:diguanylate cyclase (GGDEF)-like protein/PAS domain S-box-containing protein